MTPEAASWKHQAKSCMLDRVRQLTARVAAAAKIEALAFAVIFAVCIAVRLWHLGTVPRIITADETDNLQVAYKIIKGTGPGVFGFDWKPAPIFSLYPLAWSIQTFGDSVVAFRMFPVILSLLTIVMFYVVARESMGARAALLAMALLGTNLWFLSFSRTAWENTNAALFALGACWCTQRAIKTGRYDWWVRAGVFVAFGFYGYFTGRFIFIPVGMMAGLAIVLRQAPWRRTFFGLGLAAIVSAVLFAPQARRIYNDWDHFNSRTKNVSVFNSGKEPYEGRTNGWEIAGINLQRNIRGFIFFDKTEVGRGLWARYNPDFRPPLDLIAGPLFLAGLITGLWRWRKTYGWFTFFVPLFVAEVFSKGTPDLARGILFAPFYFLFIGLLFEELLNRIEPRRTRIIGSVAAAALVAFIGFSNVYDYFSWQRRDPTQNARLPGVDACEFSAWRTIALTAAVQRVLVAPSAVDQLHRDNHCSELLPRLPNAPTYIKSTPTPTLEAPTKPANVPGLPTRIAADTPTPTPPAEHSRACGAACAVASGVMRPIIASAYAEAAATNRSGRHGARSSNPSGRTLDAAAARYAPSTPP